MTAKLYRQCGRQPLTRLSKKPCLQVFIASPNSLTLGVDWTYCLSSNTEYAKAMEYHSKMSLQRNCGLYLASLLSHSLAGFLWGNPGVMPWAALWKKGPCGEEPKEAFCDIQRERILPGIMWMRLKAKHPWVEPLDEAVGTADRHWLQPCERDLEEESQLGHTWIPDSQKPWDNTCLLFWAANFGVICYVAIDN